MIGQTVYAWLYCKASRGIKEKEREDLINYANSKQRA